jgi:hypothetical protein
MASLRIAMAFLYGVFLGVCWECASMAILLLATATEYYFGTLVMTLVFTGIAGFTFAVAARADLARPLLSILVFRLSAQVAMTIGTGTLVAATVLSDTPTCTSSRLRKSGWRAPVVALLKLVLPRKWIRRVVGVEPPFGPPFLRVLASVASKEWLGWIPSFGLPSLLALPGTITFRPDRPSSPFSAGVAPPSQPMRPPLLPFWPMPAEAPAPPLPPAPPAPSSGPYGDGDHAFGSWFPGGSEVTGVYTYACQDTIHGAPAARTTQESGRAAWGYHTLRLLTCGALARVRDRFACPDAALLALASPRMLAGDFYYIFRYQKAFWMRPASLALLQAVGSLFVKMLLMHVYASLFMLLSQDNCREAFCAELKRRADRVRRFLKPRPPVRLIAIEPGDICAFCHEELNKPPPAADEEPPLDLAELYAARRAEAAAEGRAAEIAFHINFRVAVALRSSSRAVRWLALEMHAKGLVVAEAVTRGARATAAAATAAAATMAAGTGAAHGYGRAADAGGGGSESVGGQPATADPASAELVAAAGQEPQQQQQGPESSFVIHCRWGCGKAVHAACAAAWGRNACVYCSAPMH